MSQSWYDYGWWGTLIAGGIGASIVPVVLLVHEIRWRIQDWRDGR